VLCEQCHLFLIIFFILLKLVNCEFLYCFWCIQFTDIIIVIFFIEARRLVIFAFSKIL
jgi:hypothetical protein